MTDEKGSSQHPAPFRCVGLMGRLRGHRFMFGSWDSDRVVSVDHCERCGMPKGGWRTVAKNGSDRG